MNGGADIGKIIGLIMENPKLIEEISNLGKGDTVTEEKVGTAQKAEEAIQVAQEEPKMEKRAHSDKNRTKLLFALKPYVSKERAQAIDSMLSIVEILDAMKGR